MAKDTTSVGVGADLAAVLPNSGVRWWKQPHLLKLNYCLFSLFLFSSANGYDGSMMNGLQALPQWQDALGHPKNAWLGFINAVQSLGAFCCFPVVAWSNGRFGRKKTIAVGYFWLILGVTLQTSAQNPAMFVCGRLFVGCATAFYSASAPLLMTETAYPTHRGTVTAFYNCGWYVGSLVAAWATYGTRTYTTYWAWRIPSLLQILIPFVALPGFLMAHESPRWLISRGRNAEGRAFLTKYHGGGDDDSMLVEFEYKEIVNALEMERQVKADSSYADMFKGNGNIHRSFITITLGVFAQWNGVGIASYYLAPVLASVGVTSVTNQTMISGFLQVWNLILAVSAAFSVDRLGRRFLFLISCCGMLLSYILISALAGSFATTGISATGIAVVPFLFLYYGFYDIAFTPLAVSYTCEIWNYTYRARGLAMLNITTQLAIFFNTFVNPIALESIKWKYYLVYVGILIVITVTVYFYYPETRGHTLEEMAIVFDGGNAAVMDEDKMGQDNIQDSMDGDMKFSKTSVSDHVEKV